MSKLYVFFRREEYVLYCNEREKLYFEHSGDLLFFIRMNFDRPFIFNEKGDVWEDKGSFEDFVKCP